MTGNPAQDVPHADAGVPPETDVEQTRPIRVLTSWTLLWHAARLKARSWFRAGRGTQALVAVLLLVLAAMLLRSPQPTADIGGRTQAAEQASATWKPAPPLPAWAGQRKPVAAQQDPAAIAPRTPGDHELAQLPRAVIGEVIPAAPTDPGPGNTPGTTVVHPTRDVAVYAEPGGCAVAVLPPRQVLTATWVPVLDRTPGWVQVMLPVRPHPGGTAAVGWIHLNPDVEVTEREHRIDIDTTNGRVSVLTEVAHAAATVPVADQQIRPPTGPAGGGHRSFVAVTGQFDLAPWLPRLLPLAADTSRVCTEAWTTVSVPGLPATTPLGTLDHDGCVPAPAPLRAALTQVPVGTVVILR
jgi:hypothetical protein